MIAPQKIATGTTGHLSLARLGVVLVTVLWLVAASQLPYSLSGTGIVLLLALVGLDAALGAVTGWLAFASSSRLDERQKALRDRAYRIGFRLIGAGVLVMFLLYIAGVILRSMIESGPIQLPSDGFSARTALALAELLVIAPTAVIAWILPPGKESEEPRPIRWIPLVAVPAVALAWILAVLVGPVQATRLSMVPDGGFGMSDATCGHFSAVDRVASGFGGSARLEAEVCWNRQQAFTVGDPSLPSPASLPAEEFSHPFPGETACAPATIDTDFGTVVEHCVAQIDADGTLRMALNGRISPLPGGIGSRDVEMHLVVTRNGKLVRFD
jgi:hypothetical protein